LRIAGRLGDSKENAGRGDLVSAIGAGEEPVVADAPTAAAIVAARNAALELVTRAPRDMGDHR
jgi:hypothetical protein